MSLRILIADDHEIVRRGVRQLLESHDGWTVCGEAIDGLQAVEQAAALRPDVIVMDIAMPQLSGIEATRRIIGSDGRCPSVLILSMKDSEALVREVLAAGARGVVLKSDAGEDLVEAVQTVSEGQTFLSSRVADFVAEGASGKEAGSAIVAQELTTRERQVLHLLAEGRSNKQIAVLLKISVKTAETHRSNLMKKLRVQSLSELIRYAIRNQLVEL